MDFDAKTENPIWVIYEGAADRTGPYTVRLRVVGKGGETRVDNRAFDFGGLETARIHVLTEARRLGVYPMRFDRAESGDPVIVESWL